MCCQITKEEQPFVILLTQEDEIEVSEMIKTSQRLKLMANLVKIGAYEIC